MRSRTVWNAARMMRLGTAAGLLASLIAGCSGPKPSAQPPASAVATTAAEATPAGMQKADDEFHDHEAPHGGSLIEVGEEFAHLELLLDAATGRLTAYALDGEAEQSVRLAQPSIVMSLAMPSVSSPVEVTLAPVENALTGEKAGDTSQFTAVVPALRGQTAFQGSVASLAIRGRTFSQVEFAFPATDH